MKTHDPADPKTVTTRAGTLTLQEVAEELLQVQLLRAERLQRELDEARALLHDCEVGIRTNWDASPPEWVPPSKAEVLSRIKTLLARLERRDG